MLYNLISCEHRPWMDLYADPSERDAASPFVEMLWRRGGAQKDQRISANSPGTLDLRSLPIPAREDETLAAMRRGEMLIYGGRIAIGDLLGEPDILRYEDDKYVPGIISAGSGDEGPTSGVRTPKKHYGVQLALYVDVLERLGFSDGQKQAFVWDIHNNEVLYDLAYVRDSKGSRSLWEDYLLCLGTMREIASGTLNPGPAYQAECKLCPWYSACVENLERLDDLTLLPGLGRKTRTSMLPYAKTVLEFADAPIERFLNKKGKSIIHGVSAESLERLREYAQLRSAHGEAFVKADVILPTASIEFFLDIETDPTQDLCYLHGFVIRRAGVQSAEYIPFLAKSAGAQTNVTLFPRRYHSVRIGSHYYLRD